MKAEMDYLIARSFKQGIVAGIVLTLLLGAVVVIVTGCEDDAEEAYQIMEETDVTMEAK